MEKTSAAVAATGLQADRGRLLLLAAAGVFPLLRGYGETRVAPAGDSMHASAAPALHLLKLHGSV